MATQDWIDFGLLMMMVVPFGVLCGWLGYRAWKQAPNEAAPALEAKKWGILIPILIVVGGYVFFAYLLAPILFGLMYSLYFSDTSATIEAWVKLPYVNFAYSALFTSLQLSLMLWYLLRRGSSLRSIGFNRLKSRYLINGVIAYGCYFLLYFGAFALIYTFIPAINLEQEQELGFAPITEFDRLLTFGALVIIPPIAEELMVRGFLYHSLKPRMRKNIAILLTSLLFAAAHLQIGSGSAPLWVAAIDTFILAIVLIKVTDYSKSLWPAIFAHMIKNTVAFVSLFVLSR